VLLAMDPINANSQEKVIDKQFIAASSYLVLTTIADIETTFSVIHHGGHEENPVMKPLFKSGRPAVYAAQFGIDAFVIYLSYQMKKSKYKEFNKTWWIAPMILGTSHAACAGLNFRYIW